MIPAQRAYDAAVQRCREREELHTLAVPLETFVQQLFGETNYALIADSKPYIGDLMLREAFKDAQVRFMITHFIRAGDGSAVTTEAAYMLPFCDPWHSNVPLIRSISIFWFLSF